DKRYGQFIINRKDDYRGWQFITLSKAFADSLRISEREIKRIPNHEEKLEEFILTIVRTVFDKNSQLPLRCV
ncbi:MAG: hypothetical protein M3R15_26985, partial [Acidobacteriota bacterium]|nr:hypothetical protein [Acidobacteriota bacterium]